MPGLSNRKDLSDGLLWEKKDELRGKIRGWSQQEAREAKKSYEADPSKKIQAQKKSYEAGPGKKLQAQKKVYEADPSEKLQAQKKSYEADPSKKLKAQKKSYEADPSKSREAERNRYNAANKKQQWTGTTPILFQRKLQIWCITAAQRKRIMQDYYRWCCSRLLLNKQKGYYKSGLSKRAAKLVRRTELKTHAQVSFKIMQDYARHLAREISVILQEVCAYLT